jgi:hypothetical protein
MCPRPTHSPTLVHRSPYSRSPNNRLPPQCQRPNVRCPRMAARRAGARIHPFAFRFLPSFESRFQSGVQSHQRAHHVKGLGKIEMRPQITFLLAGSALCWTRPEKAIRIYRPRQQNTSFPERLSTIGSRSPVPLALVRKPCMQGSRADC